MRLSDAFADVEASAASGPRDAAKTSLVVVEPCPYCDSGWRRNPIYDAAHKERNNGAKYPGQEEALNHAPTVKCSTCGGRGVRGVAVVPLLEAVRSAMGVPKAETLQDYILTTVTDALKDSMTERQDVLRRFVVDLIHEEAATAPPPGETARKAADYWVVEAAQTFTACCPADPTGGVWSNDEIECLRLIRHALARRAELARLEGRDATG